MSVQETNEIVISVKGLVKRYPGAKDLALKGVDLDINRGKFFGLLGPNGGGKTTLISILCGLISASGGEAFVLGHKVRRAMRKVRPFIGLVPQEIALYPILTLQQNLDFFGKLYGLSGSLLQERITKYVEIVQLTHFFHRPVQSFSGGMKRRANLAAGLLHEPDIIFLDEPTANVDPQSRRVIFEALKELNQKNKTLIYTTHHLEAAQQLCNEIAVIDRGVIISRGTPMGLIESYPDCHNLDDVFFHLTGKHLRD